MFSRCLVSQVKHNSYFLIGLSIGLWLSLAVIPLDEDPVPCVTSAGSAAPLTDEYEPQREEKPLGNGGQTAGRSVQRPRYYSTELGMRGSLLTGVLSSEESLKNQVAAINRTAARLQPALKFFITASAMSSVPGLANVVGMYHTREMLKPFHALKYLADNYLEEYDFFFIVSDTAFVNARRLIELVSQLSVSQDVYMGMIAEDDSHYCSLESGIILSNSVLRGIHNELDWCVRNSYSPHHHENIGRCVLHAAHLSCQSELQGERYMSMVASEDNGGAPISSALADAVTVHPVTQPRSFYQLQAYISRVFLERDHDEVLNLRGYLWHNSVRHPVGYRNATWPAGLRSDPGLASPLPENRFDYIRWTSFNNTHAFMPDDHRTIGPITGANKQAIDLVLDSAKAWALNRWPEAEETQFIEGSWKWEPAQSLSYILLFKLIAKDPGNSHLMRQIQVVRPLGAARLVPVRYVTESARVTILLPLVLTPQTLLDTPGFLQKYESLCITQDKNTALIVVIIRQQSDNVTSSNSIHESLGAIATKHKNTQIETLESSMDDFPDADEVELFERAGRVAITTAATKLARDALVLIVVPHMDYNQDFLNRVRMNTIQGEQWYLPSAFARFALYDHPRFLTPAGAKPQVNTGRFNLNVHNVLSFYRSDYDSAIAEYRGPQSSSVADILAKSPLRCIFAPEPGVVLSPRPPACQHSPQRDNCIKRLRDDNFAHLDFGARHSLAQLLLEYQADLS
ncbi:hypothetical protein K1T71_013124 [Dendrolimus kikuchii]|uniref:Uncharacterized protein n=1 Tax=Dendrolimus kikuchii TaxID=765133 RepID=A0ACC1CJ25_9NEOP|nr:hypothetical protein K1T71_013124 [Dendrolimus kikuchii]